MPNRPTTRLTYVSARLYGKRMDGLKLPDRPLNRPMHFAVRLSDQYSDCLKLPQKPRTQPMHGPAKGWLAGLQFLRHISLRRNTDFDQNATR